MVFLPHIHYTTFVSIRIICLEKSAVKKGHRQKAAAYNRNSIYTYWYNISYLSYYESLVLKKDQSKLVSNPLLYYITA